MLNLGRKTYLINDTLAQTQASFKVHTIETLPSSLYKNPNTMPQLTTIELTT